MACSAGVLLLVLLSCLHAPVVEGIDPRVGAARDATSVGSDPLALVDSLAARRVGSLVGTMVARLS